jgi:predicted small lipoprotein YifL
MVTQQITALVAACCVAVTLGGCGKGPASPEPTDKQRAESRERAKESPVFGTQVQALDSAKATADEAAKVAADRAKKADQ